MDIIVEHAVSIKWTSKFNCWVVTPTFTNFLRPVVSTMLTFQSRTAVEHSNEQPSVLFLQWAPPSYIHLPSTSSHSAQTFPIFHFYSSASVCCYCEHKQKVKQGRLGTRLGLEMIESWEGLERRGGGGLNLWDQIRMHTLSEQYMCCMYR